jgi:tetratricopeptide (TPR) repeat protein
MNTTDNRFHSCSRARRVAAVICCAVLVSTAAQLALPAPASAGQFNATVRGKVTGPDGEPLEGVKVVIRKVVQDPTRPIDPVELTTDEDGNYYARNVSLGDTILSFEYEGMEYLEEQRELRAGPVRIDVEMKAVEVPDEFVQAQVANDAYGTAADAFNAGDYSTAVTQAKAALEMLDDTPENAEALAYVYALLGASYSRQRMFDEAIDAFTKRLGYVQDAAAHLELAQALADSGDQEAARPHFEAALELDPDDAMTQYNVGVTMVNANDVEAGIAHIERAIELQPVYPLAYKNLGYAYARVERYQDAINVFEKYLEQAPDAGDAAQIRDFIAALKEMIG